MSASAPRTAGAGRPLLELDPELGQLLTAERREIAERELRVRVSSFPVGEWDGGRLTDADPMHLGLLLVDGVLAREVVLGDTVSTELLGPGDILRPWHIEGPPELLNVAIRWNALSSVRLALIDRRGLGRDRYEFQMLLGVAEDARRRLIADGHHLRVYVPFGRAWYAYSVRRLKENPSIAGYVARDVLRGFAGRA